MFSQSPRVPAPRVADFYEAYREGKADDFYQSHVVDDDELARGLADGTYAIDTRLRDALHSHRPISTGHEFDAGYVSEVAMLEDASAFVRAQQRVDALEARLSQLERSFSARLRAKLTSPA
jgi:hypothetical protein